MKTLDPEAQRRALHHANQIAAGVLNKPIRVTPPNVLRMARDLLRMKPAI